jgi:hypothetical protein
LSTIINDVVFFHIFSEEAKRKRKMHEKKLRGSSGGDGKNAPENSFIGMVSNIFGAWGTTIPEEDEAASSGVDDAHDGRYGVLCGVVLTFKGSVLIKSIVLLPRSPLTHYPQLESPHRHFHFRRETFLHSPAALILDANL